MPDSNISDSMAESIFNNEIIQNMTDETFDKILDVIGFTVPNILRDIPVFNKVYGSKETITIFKGII